MWAMLGVWFLVTSAVIVVGLLAIRSTEQVAVDERIQTEAEQRLMGLTRSIDDLVVDTQEATDRQVPFALNRNNLAADTNDIIEDVRTDFDALYPNRSADGDLAIVTLRDSIIELSEQAEQVVLLIGADDALAESRQISVLSARNREYQQSLDNVQAIFDRANADRLDDLVAAGERRTTLLRITVVLIALFGVGAVLLIRKVRREESALLQTVAQERAYLQAIVDCVPASLAWKDRDSVVIGVNRTLKEWLEAFNVPDLIGKRVSDVVQTAGRTTWMEIERLEQEAIATGGTCDEEFTVPTRAGLRTFRYSTSAIHLGGSIIGGVTFNEDVTESREMERALSTANRMESIGQMAAGVAHEINTPVQYVSDNTEFLTQAFDDVLQGVDRLVEMATNGDAGNLDATIAAMDLDFLREEVPSALAQSREGLDRVTKIVRAMKDFSHTGGTIGKRDLNRMIESTAAVSRNEWTYVADLRLKLDPGLPHVTCSEGQLNQAILSMIVNAAEAVSEAHGPDGRGNIIISTAQADAADSGEPCIQITIEDDGAGMTAEVQDRIFNQFFTTKDVGKGTGQGLSMAWEVINGHGGSIDVVSEVGIGTKFVVSLPLDPEPDGAERSEAASSPAATATAQ
jgi:signal transduction histidine kinase